MGYTIQRSVASPSGNLDDDNNNGDNAECGDGVSDSCSDSEASVYDDDYIEQSGIDENNLYTHCSPRGDRELLTSTSISSLRQRRPVPTNDL